MLNVVPCAILDWHAGSVELKTVVRQSVSLRKPAELRPMGGCGRVVQLAVDVLAILEHFIAAHLDGP